jgi:hypothetical protein
MCRGLAEQPGFPYALGPRVERLARLPENAPLSRPGWNEKSMLICGERVVEGGPG